VNPVPQFVSSLTRWVPWYPGGQSAVGWAVGWAVGFDVVGFDVGWAVGLEVGLEVVGFEVGWAVGVAVVHNGIQRSQPLLAKFFPCPVLHWPFDPRSS